MSKKSKQKTKKAQKIIISILVFVLIAVATFFCLKIFLKKNKTGSQDIQKLDEPVNKVIEFESEPTSTETKKEDGIKIIDENDPNNSETVTGVITYAAKTNKGTFRIVATTDQALSEGNCDLTFSNGSTILTATAETVARANNTTCTFELDLNKIASGKWNISIKITTTKDRSGVIEDVVEVE